MNVFDSIPTPQEAGELTMDEYQQVERIAQQVQTAIQRQYTPGMTSIRIKIPFTSQRVRNELTRGFRLRGWDASFTTGTDQRDGDTLALRDATLAAKYYSK